MNDKEIHDLIDDNNMDDSGIQDILKKLIGRISELEDRSSKDGYKASQENSDSYELLVYKNVVVRTVTHIFIGKLTQVTDFDIVLHDQIWVADGGRWHKMLSGVFDKNAEVEVYPKGIPSVLPRGGIIEVILWPHDIPTKSTERKP